MPSMFQALSIALKNRMLSQGREPSSLATGSSDHVTHPLLQLLTNKKGSQEEGAASQEGKREADMTREEEGRNAGWTMERMLVPLSERGSPMQGSEKRRRCRGGRGHEGLNMSPESGRE